MQPVPMSEVEIDLRLDASVSGFADRAPLMSARNLVSRGQRNFLAGLVVAAVIGLVLNIRFTIAAIVGVFTLLYLWGESIAINVFHPVIGLVLFGVGLIVMLLLIRPLGMEIPIGSTSPPASSNATAPIASNFGSPQEPQKQHKVTLAVPRVYLAVVAVVVAALVIGVSDVGLSDYNLVAGVSGNAKLSAYIQGPVAPPGWTAQYETSYAWAKPLFGDTSVWNRYVMRAEGSGSLQYEGLSGGRRHQYPRPLQFFCLRRSGVLYVPRLRAC